MNFLANQEGYLGVTEFLKDQIHTKGYEWDTARMKPMDAELYANAQIEVGGTVPLLTGASQEVKGVTNFNGNKLVKGRVFVADGVAIGWAEGADGTAVHSLSYNYGNVPACLAQANLVLKQKDESVIKLPISSITNANGRGRDDVYRTLNAFALIEDDSIVDYDIEFPQGVKYTPATAGNKLFVSAYLRGFETYLKR